MSLFTLRSDIDTTSRAMKSRTNRLIYMPSFNTVTYGKDSIKYQCAKLWNATFKTGVLNVDAMSKVKIEGITTERTFNSTLKRYFLYSYTVEPVSIYY